MPSPARMPADVIAALEAACAAWPDQRVAQVIVNALGEDPFFTEDGRAAEKLRHYASTADRHA